MLLEDLVTTSVEWTPPQHLRNALWRQRPQEERRLLQWLTQGADGGQEHIGIGRDHPA